MDTARNRSENMGLSMNVKKTKTMVVSREDNCRRADILVNNEYDLAYQFINKVVCQPYRISDQI